MFSEFTVSGEPTELDILVEDIQEKGREKAKKG